MSLPDRYNDQHESADLVTWMGERLRLAFTAQGMAEVEVARHARRAWVKANYEQIDAQVVGEAARGSAEEELLTLAHGRMLAAEGDAISDAIVKDKLMLQARLNDRRLTRKFG